MRGLAIAKSSRFGWLIAAIAVSSIAGCGISRSVFADDGSVIGATVCTSASTITLTAPVSDSVVTDASVSIAGTVTQASQIEIQIDGTFDSILPLTIGQTSFSGTVQLTKGTHTITATAVSICPGASGSAAVVVTYEPAVETPSTGGQTGTNTEGDKSVGGVTINSEGSTITSPPQSGFGFFSPILQPLEGIASWLNLNTGDSSGDVASMPVVRALVFTGGIYLFVIGIAPSLVQVVASLPVIVSTIPAMTLTHRMRLLSRGGRIIGLLLMIGALFIP